MSVHKSNTKLKKSTPDDNDKAFYKILAMFIAAAVLEVLFVAVYRRYYANTADADLKAGMMVLAIVCAVLCAGSTAVSFLFRKKNKRIAGQLGGSAAVMLFLCFAAWILASRGLTAAKLLCVMCPVLLLLYIVLIIYQREFFISALLGAACLVTLWTEKQYLSFNHLYPVIMLCTMLALDAAVAVLTVISSKNNGTLGSKDGLLIFELRESKTMLLIVCALSALTELLGFFIGAAIAEVAMYIIAVCIFILAVYYTIKLM